MAPLRTSEGCWPAAWLQQVQQDHNVVPFALVRSFKEAKSRLSEQAYAARFSTCLTSLESWPPVSRRSPPVIRCTSGSTDRGRFDTSHGSACTLSVAELIGSAATDGFFPRDPDGGGAVGLELAASGEDKSLWHSSEVAREERMRTRCCARVRSVFWPGSSHSHNSGGVRKQSEDEVRVVSAWARYVHARLRTVVERSVYRNRRSISGARMHAACCGRGSATGWEGCTPATASMTTTPGRGIAPYYAANEESGTK